MTITVGNLRKLLFSIKNQDMTVRELRALLFDALDQNVVLDEQDMGVWLGLESSPIEPNPSDFSKVFPAGKYYVGDLCYAVNRDAWGMICDATGRGFGHSDVCVDGVFYYRGVKCFLDMTAYGDGEYKDNRGREYGVDSGTIGIMPIDVCDGNSMEGGQVIEFINDFTVSCETGVFKFGGIRINTR